MSEKPKSESETLPMILGLIVIFGTCAAAPVGCGLLARAFLWGAGL